MGTRTAPTKLFGHGDEVSEERGIGVPCGHIQVVEFDHGDLL